MRWFPNGDFIGKAEILLGFVKEYFPDLLRPAGEFKARRPHKDDASRVDERQ